MQALPVTLQIKVALRSIDAHILYFPVKQFNIAVVGKAQCLQSPAFLLDFRFVVWFAPRGDDHFPRHAGIDLAEGNQLPVFHAVPFFQLADTCRAYKLVHLVTAYRKCFHTDTVSTFHQQKRPVTVHLQADVHTTVLRTFSRGDYLTVLGLDGLGK